MTAFFPIDSYTDKNIATDILSKLLSKGSLCLFLGSGVSMSTPKEFPGWAELVKECAEPRGIDVIGIDDNTPIDTLLSTMEKVKDSFDTFDEYAMHVKGLLNKKFQLGYHHSQNMLLIAIGALVMSSKRGSINEIVTYNFDDLIEWYLFLHGYKSQVISQPPYLHEDADVQIFHPHGFLPKSSQHSQSENFIFDAFSYDITLGNEDKPWFSICQQLLLRKLAIMVGLSGDDPALRTLVARTNEKLQKNNEVRPVAFLLNLDSVIARKGESYFTKRGIVPLGFGSYDEIWHFLLKICRNALS